jgi:two-component system, NarL family, nitrate/nitrite response regulator NarL
MTSAFLVTEMRLFREILPEVLARDKRIEIVASVGLGAEMVLAARKANADVVVLQLEVAPGLVVARRLIESDPRAKIVVFGVAEDARDIAAWAKAGALGCVVQNASFDELINAIEHAARGLPSCSAAAGTALFRDIAALGARRGIDSQQRQAKLTPREREILRLVSHGLANKQIADLLSLQVATVKNHLHNIFRKLDVHDREDAAAWASGGQRASISERIAGL